jgi:hypothetical protein
MNNHQVYVSNEVEIDCRLVRVQSWNNLNCCSVVMLICEEIVDEFISSWFSST